MLYGRGKAAVLVTGAGRNKRPMTGVNAGSIPVPTLLRHSLTVNEQL